MLLTRRLLTVTRLGDLTRSGRHALIQREIVPQRADGVEPGLDVLFIGKPNSLDRQPVGEPPTT